MSFRNEPFYDLYIFLILRWKSQKSFHIGTLVTACVSVGLCVWAHRCQSCQKIFSLLFYIYISYIFLFFVKLWIIETSLHVCCAPHLTFKFTQPFDMEITKALRQLSASFGFRTSAEILQHWNIFTQTYARTHAHSHTLLSPLKRASLCLIPCEVYLLSQMSTLAVDTLCFLHWLPSSKELGTSS